VAFVLTAVGAALAVALELLEALAIVLAVAVERRPREAVLGAVAVVALGLVLHRPLRLVVGEALLLFGLEWLRKAVLRLAGRRSRSDSYAEFVAERQALEAVPAAPAGSVDWPAAIISFKGVLLEGVEVVLIVTVLASRPDGAAPAVVGAAAAMLLVVALGLVLHRPLRRVPETELKYVVGLVLTSFGTFFAAEGLGVEWPMGDAALLVVLAVWLAISQALARVLAGQARRTAVAA